MTLLLLRLTQLAFANGFFRLGLCFLGGWVIGAAFHNHLWLALGSGVVWGATLGFANLFLTRKVWELDNETYLRGGFNPDEHDGNV